MRMKNLDLIVTMLIAVMNLVWVLFFDRTPIISIILVLPLVFFLPGYAFAETLFYKRPTYDLNRIIRRPRLKIARPFNMSDRIILSLGLSFSMDILVGFILNVLPVGLQSLSWAVSLGVITTALSLLAAFFRRGTGLLINKGPSRRFHITVYECVLFVLAVAVAILSVLYSTISPNQQQHSGFTQMWILPSKQANHSCDILIGVHSFEATSVTYRIVMMINGTKVNTRSQIVLTPQQEWDQQMSLVLETADNIYVEIQLYREDTPGSMYRDVHLTLHSVRENKGRQCIT